MMPSIEVAEIEMQQIMAGSPVGPGGGSITPKDDEVDEEDLDGNRNGSFWDDED